MASLLNPKDPAVRLYMAPADGADEDPDGMSFYRALSRQYTKDPSDYGSIMNGVLDYYLRAMTNPQHPDHEVAHWHEDRTIAQVHTFFNALACPDAVLPNDWQYVMSFIADSLNIGLHFWERTHNPAEGKSSYTRIGSCGRAHAPAYQILRSSSKLHHSTGSIHISHFSSLIQDESGKDLILFLQREKDAMQRESVDNPETRRYNGLEIKRICWWWRTEANQALYNGRDDGAFDEVRYVISTGEA